VRGSVFYLYHYLSVSCGNLRSLIASSCTIFHSAQYIVSASSCFLVNILLHNVCVLGDRQEDPVPNFYDVVRLSQHWPSGSTLMWAVVDSGDVTFFAFHPVTLPTDVDVAGM